MSEYTQQTRIFADPRSPDVVMVVAEDWTPSVISVIHAPLCENYWAHPSSR